MKTIDTKVQKIIDSCFSGSAPSKNDCALLLSYGEITAEAAFTRAAADSITRRRFGNEAIILGQIGIETDSCPGKCKFCAFGDGHSDFRKSVLSVDEIVSYACDFTDSGDVYALFLMTLHNYDFERLLAIVSKLRLVLPQKQQLVVNMGDFDNVQAEELKKTGVNGAYHVCRLREGIDTALNPADRKKTVEGLKKTGLNWYYCCEPIGPEHTPEELVEQLFLGIDLGCFQHAAMRRVSIPGKPLAHFGQITELRLAQITAVVSLASLGNGEIKNIAVHEPNLIGLTSGANVVYAEKGANPRDTEKETETGRGRDVTSCKTMLAEAGFTSLLTSQHGLNPLNLVSELSGANKHGTLK